MGVGGQTPLFKHTNLTLPTYRFLALSDAIHACIESAEFIESYILLIFSLLKRLKDKKMETILLFGGREIILYSMLYDCCL